MKIVDIHSHTNFSNCGRDKPEELILEMIKQGVEVLGISDHNHGVLDRDEEYQKSIRKLGEKYKDQIQILCGLEICTHEPYNMRVGKIPVGYDYCLIENLDNPVSIMRGDILSYVEKFPCPIGIAHTDIFAFIEKNGLDAERYLKSLVARNIFWELNVSYDSIHGYREHEYVKEFMKNPVQQELVKRTGLMLSVGFDGHRKEDYAVDRVRSANEFIRKNGFPHAIDYILSKK